ncbi:MAG TPA: GntR family transcriptional regulator [Dermatophilaceae bacterium]|nr:GntR family transcriptional regulator [Dermatophilaceae bacterium]
MSTRHTEAIVDGPVPKHVQLTRILADLATGPVGPDQAIPSERELMVTFGVSRATVRQAVQSLITEGVLQRAHGKGTFVRAKRHESQLHLASFTQDMRRRGFVPTTQVLRVELDRPLDDVVASLRLADGEPAWRVDRLRLADGVPIALENGWYAAGLLPGLGDRDLSGSLYELLATDYGVVIDAAEQTVWAENADTGLARLLQAPQHCPLMVFRRVSRAGSRPVEHVVSRYRGDRYQIQMTLAGPPATTPAGPPATTTPAGPPANTRRDLP